MKTLDGLQLHHNAAVDQQVQFEPTTDALPFVVKGDMLLAGDAKAFPPHFDEHAFPVHRLQQSRSEDPVYFNGAANDLLRQFLDFWRGIHVPLQEHETCRHVSKGFRAGESRRRQKLQLVPDPDSG